MTDTKNGKLEPQKQDPSASDLRDFVKVSSGRSHIFWSAFENGQDGTGESILSEPIPEFYSRPGDKIIRPEIDNNTMIIMGRDRTGLGEIDNLLSEKNSQSGYSDHMAAGAIDIVVGRMAPFPVSFPGYSLGPLYVTHPDIPELKMQPLSGNDPEPFVTSHPGYAMDAARVYISQMTNVDENFLVEKSIHPSNLGNPNTERIATSAVMVKADKVRLHARQDIKIVTGGVLEPYNSQGNEITSTGGIHLMAGNESNSQEPIPKGLLLVEALEEMEKQVSQALDLMFKFAEVQMKFNKIIGTHVHQSPFQGIATTPSITAAPGSMDNLASMFSGVVIQISSMQKNINSYKNKYLRSGGSNYINSYHNTTN